MNAREQVVELAQEANDTDPEWWEIAPRIRDVTGDLFDLWSRFETLKDAVKQRSDLVEGVITHREIDPRLHGLTAHDDAVNICDQRVDDAADELLRTDRKVA